MPNNANCMTAQISRRCTCNNHLQEILELPVYGKSNNNYCYIIIIVQALAGLHSGVEWTQKVGAIRLDEIVVKLRAYNLKVNCK